MIKNKEWLKHELESIGFYSIIIFDAYIDATYMTTWIRWWNDCGWVDIKNECDGDNNKHGYFKFPKEPLKRFIVIMEEYKRKVEEND